MEQQQENEKQQQQHAQQKTEYEQHNHYSMLVEFAHRHVDFHMAELESILSMNGLVVGRDIFVHPLPACPTNDNIEMENEKREISNASLPSNESVDGGVYQQDNKFRPFLILSLPYHAALERFDLEEVKDQQILEKDTRKPTIASILSRCTLIRSLTELWGCGATMEDCVADVESLFRLGESGESRENVDTAKPLPGQGIQENFNKTVDTIVNPKVDLKQEYVPQIQKRLKDPQRSWKMTIHTLGCTFTRDHQDGIRRKLLSALTATQEPLLPAGPVKMSNPDDEFLVIREVRLNRLGSPDTSPATPLAVYFGRILGEGRDWRMKGKGLHHNLDLKKRKYLGPTSMDAELSLVMTNLARVQQSSFCLDPFCGTGGVLLACASRGGYCVGTDIDIRALRGGTAKTSEKNIFSNFEQARLPRPDIIRCDNSLYARHFRYHKPMYDAIVCDPPYGIRAGARQTGTKRKGPIRPIPEQTRHDHIAQTKPYKASDVIKDLLDLAAKTLVGGGKGRLIYVIPIAVDDFEPERDLPSHPCLKTVYLCFQPLQLHLGRMFITMEKIAEYDYEKREAYLAKVWGEDSDDPTSTCAAERFEGIHDRLLQLARSKPGYDEKSAFRKQKKRAAKDSKKQTK